MSKASRACGERRCRLPQANLHVLGEHAIGSTPDGHPFDVRYIAPGHASHHVSYFRRAERHRRGPATRPACGSTSRVFTLPPTPPPDIDLDAWREHREAARVEAGEPCSSRTSAPTAGVERTSRSSREQSRRRSSRRWRSASIDSDASDEAKCEQFRADVSRLRPRRAEVEDVTRAARAGRPAGVQLGEGWFDYWREKGFVTVITSHRGGTQRHRGDEGGLRPRARSSREKHAKPT